MKAIRPIESGWARRLLVVVVATWAALLGFPAPSAFAQGCPDVEVVFARGTHEPPGVGGVGQAFVDSLRAQIGGRSLGVYGVDYPASGDFPRPGDIQGGLNFLSTVVNGIYNARDRVQFMAANCPNTRIVLGGYSQGAALAGFVTSAEVPAEVPAEYLQYVPRPMPPDVADHVAAVALFGKPSEPFLRTYGAPPVRIGPLYAPKTIELCAPGDDICSGVPGGQPGIAHIMYGMNGMTNEAATFVAGRL